MADEIDQATEVADLHLEAALENAKLKAPERRTGRCLNCFEPLDRGAYCDSDCQRDHEMRVGFRNARH